MKIVVCVKQVPDTKGGVKFNPDGTLDRGAMLTIMNPDDKAGLEAALRLKTIMEQRLPLLPWDFPRQKRFFVSAGQGQPHLLKGVYLKVRFSEFQTSGNRKEIRLRE